MANLQYLYLSENELSGTIPAELARLTNLQTLSLYGNALSGPIPAGLGNLTNLEDLYLFANPLTGPLPQRLTQLSLRSFWIHFTQACAPADAAFQAWVGTIQRFRGTICGQDRTGNFTYATLTPGETGVRAIHVNELRQLVNTVRAVCELPHAHWTDPVITGETPVKAVHLTELRAALTEAYGACSLSPPTYTDPTIVPGATPVRAVHWTELRAAGLRGLEATGP